MLKIVHTFTVIVSVPIDFCQYREVAPQANEEMREKRESNGSMSSPSVKDKAKTREKIKLVSHQQIVKIMILWDGK
jgi:hypothetical protein